MSILGKFNTNLIEDEDTQETTGFTTPAVIRHDKDELTLKKSIVISSIIHPSFVATIWLITIILALLGIHLNLFEKPVTKKNDIEFVLVEKEEPPINKKTPYRADRNSRAGGHHDPTRKVSMPSAPASAPAKKSAPAQASKPAAKQPQQPKKPAPAKNPLQNLIPKPQKTEHAPAPAPKAPAPARPNPPTARPSIKPPNTPKPVAKPTSGFQIPVPKASAPSAGGHYATGPISGSGKAANGGSQTGGTGTSGKYTPAPVLAPTASGSGAGSKLGKAGGTGSGTGSHGSGSGIGNPGPGNPNGRPGIDAIREPDFGPYMRELQRRIKMNWNPPKGNESKRVVLLFKIAKDGRLLSCSVFKSSGLPGADNAAIQAVKLTAPFKPLPADFKGQSIDIQFTFDYNVFGASGY